MIVVGGGGSQICPVIAVKTCVGVILTDLFISKDVERAGGGAQVVEHWSSKCEALVQVPVPLDKRKKEMWVENSQSTG
jgi:hypothetical protein